MNWSLPDSLRKRLETQTKAKELLLDFKPCASAKKAYPITKKQKCK